MQGDGPSVASALGKLVRRAIAAEGGWIGFDRFMALALYAPGLGYYANASRKFGALPHSGSDFVTAPEMTPLFGHALALQVAEAQQRTGMHEIWEFGAGSGALAAQMLDALGGGVRRYTIVELSAALRERQREALARHADTVVWVSELPEAMEGVVVGNELLDAMPVKLLARVGGVWHERGISQARAEEDPSIPQDDTGGPVGAFVWADRPTDLRPPIDVPGTHDYVTEIHPQAQAFIRTLGDRLQRGAAFFLDYGFPEREYWHPQRHMGTLNVHRGHRSGGDPLADVGLQDLTAHVDFTGIAVAAQEAGFSVLGYTSQARFLLNCGLLSKAEQESQAGRAAAHRLIAEHEMGELFKVIGLCKGRTWDAIGFGEGDRTHTL